MLLLIILSKKIQSHGKSIKKHNLFQSKNFFSFFLLLIIFSLFIVYATNAFSVPKKLFRDIYEKTLTNKAIGHRFLEEYLEEVKGLYQHKNMDVDTSIKYVFVLSGRSSYLKQPVDNPYVKDLDDDYNRLQLGINIARKVVIRHLNKLTPTQEDIQKYGPQIIYNGRPKHNAALKKALREGILTHYPKNKFIILNLQEWSTRGQFISIKKERPLFNTTIAIVTHAYHFPRVARMINSQWHPFGIKTKILFYLVDRKLKAPGIKEDMIGEIKRIPIYINTGDLAPKISTQISY